MIIIKRCSFCNLKNPLYVKYHDEEWGRINRDDHYLFEMFILEMFQAGLSFECILNKREAFKKAYDNFLIDKIILYDDLKVNELLNNKDIVRNKLKILASINNAKIFKEISICYGGFYNYLITYFKNGIIYEVGYTSNDISNSIANDLKKRGMKFIGSTTIYAYLQAVGLIYAHEEGCFLGKK